MTTGGNDGVDLDADVVINAAGLDALALAKRSAGSSRYGHLEAVLAKGS